MNFFSDLIGSIRFSALLAALAIFMALPVRADMYTWTDANGVKHFSNEAPSNGQKSDRRKEVKHSADQYEQWEQQRQSRQDQVLENSRSDVGQAPEKALPGRQAKVVMYATATCKYCARARAFFAKHGIAYTEYDISADQKARERFKGLNGTGVPLIFVGDKRIPGFNERLLRHLLALN